MDCDYNLIDWVEKEAKENIRHRLHIAELLAKAAEYTLMVLFIGLGGSMAFVINNIKHIDLWYVCGVAVVVFWLMACAYMTVYFCMMSRSLPPPSNEPKNIFQPEYGLDALRKVELDNIQMRITQIVHRNCYIAGWLNRIRRMVLLTPFVFIVASALAAVY